MDKFRETILLDHKLYNENGYWDVPILRVNGISASNLYIDGNEIPPGQYFIDKNHLKLTGIKPKVIETTRAELIVEFANSNKKLTFWLPIILAVIGLLGTIAQPVLHELNLLYKPGRILHIDNTAYWYEPDKLAGEISVYPIKEHLFRSDGFISEDEINDWDFYVAATVSNNVKDPFDQEYKFFSGPLKLQVGAPIPFEVDTDSLYTKEVREKAEGIFRIIALVKKGTHISSSIFKPSEIPGIKIIGKSYYYPCEKMLYK